MRKLINVLAVIAGIVLVALAIYYWATPADALPHFFPGYDAAKAVPHFKHGLGSLILGLGAFAYAWFATGKGKKRTLEAEHDQTKNSGQ